MAFWILIFLTIVTACNFPELPPIVTYFSPAFEETGHLEASGRFLAPETTLT